jgi:endonuclease-3 related protein
MAPEAALLRAMYERLADAYGPQHWWPGESPLEIVLGAYLTQNTSWRAVERSIANLRERGLMDAAALLACPEEQLRELIRPSGSMTRKSAAIRAFLGLLYAEAEGSFKRLAAMPPSRLRPRLLALPGVGPETADAILLYALGQEAMVVDEYLRRVTSRHGLAPAGAGYDPLQRLAWSAFPGERGRARVRHANEFHALIVSVGKEHCGPTPRCAGCPLAGFPALLPQAVASPAVSFGAVADGAVADLALVAIERPGRARREPKPPAGMGRAQTRGSRTPGGSVGDSARRRISPAARDPSIP